MDLISGKIIKDQNLYLLYILQMGDTGLNSPGHPSSTGQDYVEDD